MTNNNADFHFIRFKIYQDGALWYGVSINSYDALGTVVETSANSKHQLYNNLYLEISDMFFDIYATDMFINTDFTVDFLLTRENLNFLKLHKSN